MPESEVLPESNCRSLLAAGVVGRVGLCTAEGPVVIPVNYGVVGEMVVLRTSDEGVLAGIAEGQLVAFEIDFLDHEYQHGWSVLARGPVHILTDEAELALVRRSWEPRPWASGPRPRHLAIRWTELTGRRLGTGWSLVKDLPARRRLDSPRS